MWKEHDSLFWQWFKILAIKIFKGDSQYHAFSKSLKLPHIPYFCGLSKCPGRSISMHNFPVDDYADIVILKTI
jgi:hypothetical protein